MLVAILIPSWDTMPLVSEQTSDSLVALPPALSLLMWGGLTFILIPFIRLVKNILNSNISSLADLKLSWHASKMKLSKVKDSHVWMLTSVMQFPDGSSKVSHKSRAPRRTPTYEELDNSIKELEGYVVAEVLIMLVIGYFFPVSTPWTYQNNEKVDMQPWRLRVPCATTLISCVIGLYLLFSPLGIVGGLSQLFFPLVGGLVAVNIAVWWHYGVSKLVSTPAS